MGREEEGGALHHPRPRRGDRDERPRRRAVGRARRRIRSASSRSTCRARATSPRCARTPRFVELHTAIWDVLRDEVLKGYAQQLRHDGACGAHRAARAQPARSGRSALLVAVFVLWHVLTTPGLVPPFMFDNDRQAAFFFGEPLKIFGRIWNWFVTNADIYRHLVGHAARDRARVRHRHRARAGLRAVARAAARWPRRSLDPYIKALNSMPRVILAPIFAVWFGLGIASKVALGVTLVFFIVFFNVYQGVKEVSPVVLANARMLGASAAAAAAPRLPAERDELGVQLAAHQRRAGLRRRGGRRVPRLGARRRLPDPAGRRRVRHQHRVGRHPGADRVRAGCSTPRSGASSGA